MLQSTLPEGFVADNNIPQPAKKAVQATKSVDEHGVVVELLPSLPDGFQTDNNIPEDNDVKPVKQIMKQASDPIAKVPEVTPLDYINARKEAKTQPKPEGFFGKTAEDFRQSLAESKIALSQASADQITTAETALRISGDVANFIGDVAGNAITVAIGAGGDALSFVVPDSIEKPVVDSMKEGISFIANSKAGQEGIQALMSGMQEWETWAKANPRAAENIRSVVDIGLLVGPIKGARPQPFDPVVATQTKLGRFADEVAARGAVNAQQEKRQKLVDSFIDLATDTDALKKGIDGVVDLTPMQQVAADAVASLPKYSRLRTATGNLNVVNKALKKEYEATAAAVKGAGNVNLASFYNQLTRQMDDAVSKSLDPDVTRGAYSNILEKVENAIAIHGNTAEGMLKARQNLDSWLKEQKGDAAFNKSGPVVQAVRTARDEMNNAIGEVVPSLKDSLKKQSGLLHAQDGLATKAAREASEMTFPMLRNTMRLIGTQRNIGFALSGLGIGSYATLGTPIALAAAGVGGAYLAQKAIRFGLSKAVTRKNGAIILKAVDESIKQARKMGREGVPIVRELRLQRAGFVDYLRDQNEIWENEGGKEAFAEQQRKAVQNIKALPVSVPTTQATPQPPSPPVSLQQPSAAPVSTNTGMLTPSGAQSLGSAQNISGGLTSIQLPSGGSTLPLTPKQMAAGGLAVVNGQVVITDPIKAKAFRVGDGL